MGNPSIEIIIPNWNGKELLEKNLPRVFDALQMIPTTSRSITVIDDGSTDESATYVKDAFPQVNLIENVMNIGFHRSVNYAVSKSTAQLVLLLNSDMEPDQYAFLHLYTPFMKDQDLFATTGKIYAEDKKTFLYGNRAAEFKYGHFYLKEKDENDTSQTLFACGGAGLFDRNLFIQLGGFDTLFSPFYYEEQDISYRALKSGHKIHYVPECVMYHRVQASIGKKLSQKKIKRISARNNYLFVLKNITDLSYFLSFVFFTPLFILKALMQGNPRFLVAFIMAIPRMPRAIAGRIACKRTYIFKDKHIFHMVNGNDLHG